MKIELVKELNTDFNIVFRVYIDGKHAYGSTVETSAIEIYKRAIENQELINEREVIEFHETNGENKATSWKKLEDSQTSKHP